MDEWHTGPEVVTPRMTLRPWRSEDAPVLFDIRRREDVAQWLGDPTPWADVNVAEQKIQEWTDLRRGAPFFGDWAMHPHDVAHPIGSANLTRQADGSVHIGWYLHPDHVGRGWAREAGAALLRHAWTIGVEEVWAVMWPHNEASAAVATAIGMDDLGVTEDPWYGTPEAPDSRMFHQHHPPRR